jgi:hypothetical protein
MGQGKLPLYQRRERISRNQEAGDVSFVERSSPEYVVSDIWGSHSPNSIEPCWRYDEKEKSNLLLRNTGHVPPTDCEYQEYSQYQQRKRNGGNFAKMREEELYLCFFA